MRSVRTGTIDICTDCSCRTPTGFDKCFQRFGTFDKVAAGLRPESGLIEGMLPPCRRRARRANFCRTDFVFQIRLVDIVNLTGPTSQAKSLSPVMIMTSLASALIAASPVWRLRRQPPRCRMIARPPLGDKSGYDDFECGLLICVKIPMHSHRESLEGLKVVEPPRPALSMRKQR
jgi:hypothetical protein